MTPPRSSMFLHAELAASDGQQSTIAEDKTPKYKSSFDSRPRKSTPQREVVDEPVLYQEPSSLKGVTVVDDTPQYTPIFNSRHRKSTPQKEVVDELVFCKDLSSNLKDVATKAKKPQNTSSLQSRRRKATPQMEVVEVPVIYEDLSASQQGKSNIVPPINLERQFPLTTENLEALYGPGDKGPSENIPRKIHQNIRDQLEKLAIRGLSVPKYQPFNADGSIRRDGRASMGGSAIPPQRSDGEERKRQAIAKHVPQSGCSSESWETVEDPTAAKDKGSGSPQQHILGQLTQKSFAKPRDVYLEEQRKEDKDHQRMNRIIDMEGDLFLPTIGGQIVAETAALMEKDEEGEMEEDGGRGIRSTRKGGGR
ncbi:hypothetical protein BJ875DRAFT_516016 [Amylocarpus encephaloides]|uniref:Uncharacterized protein n=1 Tax=Amylocarpus encephaloides TaxID=45428 RepID=A0A9P7YEP3_9HELO|nr:hypothetical protein BJ875DRAFT_516016 [Amylocarpus encephaloides]